MKQQPFQKCQHSWGHFQELITRFLCLNLTNIDLVHEDELWVNLCLTGRRHRKEELTLAEMGWTPDQTSVCDKLG